MALGSPSEIKILAETLVGNVKGASEVVEVVTIKEWVIILGYDVERLGFDMENDIFEIHYEPNTNEVSI